MPDYRDHHATIFLPLEMAGPIEAARHEWDPKMASRIAAHVTLVHPQTSRRGREFCERGAYQRQKHEFTAREIAVTAFDGVRWAALGTNGLACRRASNSTLQRTKARDARLGR